MTFTSWILNQSIVHAFSQDDVINDLFLFPPWLRKLERTYLFPIYLICVAQFLIFFFLAPLCYNLSTGVKNLGALHLANHRVFNHYM